MMRPHRLLALLISIFALGALHCATQPFKTGAHADSEYDFSSVKTVAFSRVPQKALNSEHGQMLRAAVEESLTSRGFEFVAVDAADLWISYDVGIFTASSVSWGKQGGPGQGRIVVRAIDPEQEREVWYGWAEANLRTNPDPERRIRSAVETLFDNRVRDRDGG